MVNNKEYYEKNKEKLREYQRNYRAKKKEEYGMCYNTWLIKVKHSGETTYRQEYYENNKDKYKESLYKWREKSDYYNKYQREYQREYKRQHPQVITEEQIQKRKEYYENNKELIKEKRKEYYQKKKESDPEYLKKRNQRRKEKRQENSK